MAQARAPTAPTAFAITRPINEDGAAKSAAPPEIDVSRLREALARKKREFQTSRVVLVSGDKHITKREQEIQYHLTVAYQANQIADSRTLFESIDTVIKFIQDENDFKNRRINMKVVWGLIAKYLLRLRYISEMRQRKKDIQKFRAYVLKAIDFINPENVQEKEIAWDLILRLLQKIEVYRNCLQKPRKQKQNAARTAV